jgi:integrase
MHVNARTQQIRFSLDGERVTLSCRRHLQQRGYLGGHIEFADVAQHVGRLLDALLSGLPPPPASLVFLDRIPRKLRMEIEERLLDRRKPSLSVGDSVDAYELHRAVELETTPETDRAAIADCDLIPREWDCRSVTEAMLRELLERLAGERGYAPSTRARIVKHWRTFFSWCELGSNPARGLGARVDRRQKDEVRPEWLDAMVDRCQVWEGRCWLRILQWTGCRLRESLSLRRCDFDLERGRITINDTKRGVVREAPLYREIECELPDDFAMWPEFTPLFSWMNHSRCIRWFDSIRERAGVPAWRPRFNAIRAMRANQLATDPRIKPEAYEILMGHTSKTAVANYLSLDDSTVALLRAGEMVLR